eukprot:Nk52_evm3s276 gene=Nk52_evmTU3s276
MGDKSLEDRSGILGKELEGIDTDPSHCARSGHRKSLSVQHGSQSKAAAFFGVNSVIELPQITKTGPSPKASPLGRRKSEQAKSLGQGNVPLHATKSSANSFTEGMGSKIMEMANDKLIKTNHLRKKILAKKLSESSVDGTEAEFNSDGVSRKANGAKLSKFFGEAPPVDQNEAEDLSANYLSVLQNETKSKFYFRELWSKCQANNEPNKSDDFSDKHNNKIRLRVPEEHQAFQNLICLNKERIIEKKLKKLIQKNASSFGNPTVVFATYNAVFSHLLDPKWAFDSELETIVILTYFSYVKAEVMLSDILLWFANVAHAENNESLYFVDWENDFFASNLKKKTHKKKSSDEKYHYFFDFDIEKEKNHDNPNYVSSSEDEVSDSTDSETTGGDQKQINYIVKEMFKVEILKRILKFLTDWIDRRMIIDDSELSRKTNLLNSVLDFVEEEAIDLVERKVFYTQNYTTNEELLMERKKELLVLLKSLQVLINIQYEESFHLSMRHSSSSQLNLSSSSSGSLSLSRSSSEHGNSTAADMLTSVTKELYENHTSPIAYINSLDKNSNNANDGKSPKKNLKAMLPLSYRSSSTPSPKQPSNPPPKAASPHLNIQTSYFSPRLSVPGSQYSSGSSMSVTPASGSNISLSSVVSDASSGERVLEVPLGSRISNNTLSPSQIESTMKEGFVGANGNASPLSPPAKLFSSQKELSQILKKNRRRSGSYRKPSIEKGNLDIGTSTQFAEQMTIIDYDLFSKIDAREFFDWLGRERKTGAFSKCNSDSLKVEGSSKEKRTSKRISGESFTSACSDMSASSAEYFSARTGDSDEKYDNDHSLRKRASPAKKRRGKSHSKKKSRNAKKEENKTANILEMSKRFNSVSNWVVSSILQEEDLLKRVARVEEFIVSAKQFFDLKNFNGLFQILSGLSNCSVSRLKRTWAKVDSALVSLHKKLQKYIHSKNYIVIRELMSRITPPCVPYLGIYLTDLTFINDGNNDFVENIEIEASSNEAPLKDTKLIMAEIHTENLINIQKFRLISKVLLELRRFQPFPYENLEKINSFQEHLKMCALTQFNEEQAYERSLYLEPREVVERKISVPLESPLKYMEQLQQKHEQTVQRVKRGEESEMNSNNFMEVDQKEDDNRHSGLLGTGDIQSQRRRSLSWNSTCALENQIALNGGSNPKGEAKKTKKRSKSGGKDSKRPKSEESPVPESNSSHSERQTKHKSKKSLGRRVSAVMNHVKNKLAMSSKAYLYTPNTSEKIESSKDSGISQSPNLERKKETLARPGVEKNPSEGLLRTPVMEEMETTSPNRSASAGVLEEAMQKIRQMEIGLSAKPDTSSFPMDKFHNMGAMRQMLAAESMTSESDDDDEGDPVIPQDWLETDEDLTCNLLRPMNPNAGSTSACSERLNDMEESILNASLHCQAFFGPDGKSDKPWLVKKYSPPMTQAERSRIAVDSKSSRGLTERLEKRKSKTGSFDEFDIKSEDERVIEEKNHAGRWKINCKYQNGEIHAVSDGYYSDQELRPPSSHPVNSETSRKMSKDTLSNNNNMSACNNGMGVEGPLFGAASSEMLFNNGSRSKCYDCKIGPQETTKGEAMKRIKKYLTAFNAKTLSFHELQYLKDNEQFTS